MYVKCPHCSQTFGVPDEAGSGKAKCPKCGTRLDLGRMLRPGDLAPGTVLGGCRIEGLLGRGGMAAVYMARQLSLDRRVALKVLPRAFARNRQFVERFSREASALARLSHPNIVGILDKGVENDTYYFVMEYVEGKSLRDRLIREAKLSPQETLQLMQGIAAGLEYAHERGIIHRDLKPGNILLDANGTPKLADFGIARIVGTDTSEAVQLTTAHMVMGSADYMAPEQRESAADVDHRTDIYALGVMLYQMLTGQLPVGTFKPVSRLIEGIPSAVDRVIRTALAPAPADRYDSVAKLRAALTQAFAETATRPSHRAAPGARRSSSPALAIAIAVAAVAAIAAVLAIVLTQKGSSPTSARNEGTRPVTATPLPRVALPQPEPEPVRKPLEKPPKPGEETALVREVLGPVRQYIMDHPDDYPGQLKRLEALILSHGNADAVFAAKKEMGGVVARLNKAIADHFARVKGLVDTSLAKREFAAALKAIERFPVNLSTEAALKQNAQLLDECRRKVAAAFGEDRKRVGALLGMGKPAEAVAVLRGVDYGLPELNQKAAAELQNAEQALADHQQQIKAEQAQARVQLTEKLKELWAKRQCSEALALANEAVAKAPDAASRAALQPQLRAATLLDAFWKTLLEAARDRKGSTVTIEGNSYKVADVEEETLVLALGAGGKSERHLRKLALGDLYELVRGRLDSKKADDSLMLGLLLTYESTPNPALAAKAFDQAQSLGAPPPLVAELRDLSAAAQAALQPEAKEPEVTGFALDFNGASDYVEVPDDKKKLSLRLKTFTIEAWVWFRPHPASEHYIVTKNAGFTTSLTYAVYLKDGNWAYATGDGVETDFLVTRAPCQPGAWVHVALVVDETQRVLYADGKAVDRSRARRRIAYDDQPLFLGARYLDSNPGGFWSGAIDDVRLTNGARYRKDFTPERQLKPDGATHLLLHFDEGKGPRARDLGPFKNHGDVRGAQFVPPTQLKLPEAPPPEPPPPKPGPPKPEPPKPPTPRPPPVKPGPARK
jgi:tRNA A-37 threonylcarbamoyl transferase component Bud32